MAAILCDRASLIILTMIRESAHPQERARIMQTLTPLSAEETGGSSGLQGTEGVPKNPSGGHHIPGIKTQTTIVK